jgi:hypothetical protein
MALLRHTIILRASPVILVAEAKPTVGTSVCDDGSHGAHQVPRTHGTDAYWLVKLANLTELSPDANYSQVRTTCFERSYFVDN